MKELIEIIDELHAPKNLKNSFGGFNYRDASGILEAVKPLLKTHECLLKITSSIEQHGERYYIVSTATIRNKAGEEVSASGPAREDESKKGMDAAQLSGACISYSKKYALCNLFCIDDSDEDPDTDVNTCKRFVIEFINNNPSWTPWLEGTLNTSFSNISGELWIQAKKIIDEELSKQNSNK